jgi:ornithine cyclodeaminase/alanine dehydrogenase-like protein (mu-crystallin family)
VSTVITLTAEDVRRHLDRRSLVDALEDIFRDGCEAPVRHHHTVAVPGGHDATLLLMPAWIPGRYVGAKVVNVFPDNGRLGIPSVQSIYLLFSGRTGELLATLDGAELTARRTVAASSLAVRYLARPDAARLLVVGTGKVAEQLADSHAAVRPIRSVGVWGRDGDKAAKLSQSLADHGFAARHVSDLASAVAQADIISCATLSANPLIRGEWLRPGAHLDLIGGYTPAMRETDDEAIRRASVFIDTAGALTEGGDIVVPLRTGVLDRSRILADLADLARARHPGRRSDDEITLFKSVGAAAEDLAAAALAYERATAQG